MFLNKKNVMQMFLSLSLPPLMVSLLSFQVRLTLSLDLFIAQLDGNDSPTDDDYVETDPSTP